MKWHVCKPRTVQLTSKITIRPRPCKLIQRAKGVGIILLIVSEPVPAPIEHVMLLHFQLTSLTREDQQAALRCCYMHSMTYGMLESPLYTSDWVLSTTTDLASNDTSVLSYELIKNNRLQIKATSSIRLQYHRSEGPKVEEPTGN